VGAAGGLETQPPLTTMAATRKVRIRTDDVVRVHMRHTMGGDRLNEGTTG
jgi:hypothetical protein